MSNRIQDNARDGGNNLYEAAKLSHHMKDIEYLPSHKNLFLR